MPATSKSKGPIAQTAVKVVNCIIGLFVEEVLPNGNEIWVEKNPYSEKQMRFALTEFLEQFVRLSEIGAYSIEYIISEPDKLDIELFIRQGTTLANFCIKENF